MPENNYDSTSGERKKRLHKRIADSDLCNRLVVMAPEDVEKVRAYAERLYKKRGLKLLPPEN